MAHITIPDNTILEKSYEMSDSEIESVQLGGHVKIYGNYIKQFIS